jgi:hypothetical protein
VANATAGAGVPFTITGSSAAAASGDAGGPIRVVPGAADGAGAVGFFAVQQPGGTAGTNEFQIYHDGTNVRLINKTTGYFRFTNSVGNAATIVVPDTTNAPTIQGDATAGTGFGIGFAIPIIWDQSGNPIVGFTSGAFSIVQAAKLGFASNAISAPDTYFTRLAAGVFGTTSWVQNTGGVAVLASAFTNANATLTATNLSWTVIAGRYYDIDLELKVSNSTAADGFQMDFGGGSCSATTFWAEIALMNGSDIAGTVTATSLTGAMNYTTVTGTCYFRVKGRLKVNAGGTLILRAAGNTDVSGTMTLAALSGGMLNDVVAL